MKVLLTTLNTKYVHTNIALKYLYKTIKNNENIEAELREFTINEPVDKIFRKIAIKNADVVAFSVYIWNIEQTLVICENLKQLHPNIKIILGGPEVTYCSKELLEKHDFIDYIIIGEGEETFSKLINGEINKCVSYRQNGDIIVGTIGIVEDTNKIPCIAEEIVKDYDGQIVYIETVRGCPYNCSYCLSSTIKGIRPFDMERVKRELLILMNAQVRLVKFVDRTFNYDKKRALEIWKFILENNISSEFHFEISAHLIDEEMLEFLKTVPKGVFRLEIGVQSTNEDTIKAINRKTDFKILSDVTKKIASFENIPMHLDLIAGLPYEGYERFKESFNDVYNLKPNELQLGFLKLLKGCQITYEKDKYNYKYTTTPPYEVLENDFISFNELMKLKMAEEMLDIYYNQDRYKNTLNMVVEKFETPFTFYYEISIYAKENGYMDRKISAEEWFDVLAKFYNEKGFVDFEIFIESLRKDHFDNFGNKRRRGLFMFQKEY